MGLSITPIHCGVLSNVERSSQQYLTGCGERIDVPLIMWLILGGERPIIVDVGVGTPDTVDEYQGRHLYQEKSPLDSLAAMGLEPADIGSVIITHAHWDHVLGLAALDFPAAKIYIQRSELDFAMHPLPTQRGLYHPREQAPYWCAHPAAPLRSPRTPSRFRAHCGASPRRTGARQEST